jgi:hypothetical protein
MDLANVTKLFKGGNAFAHDWNFPWTIMNFLDCNGFGITCINDTAVVLDRDKLTLVVKDRPVFLNEAIDHCLERWVKMGNVQLLAEFCTMQSFVISCMKVGVDCVERWGRVFAFAKDTPTVDAMKDCVKLVRLVGKTTVIMENILSPLATFGL